ncbi:MAG: TadE/TadG family type IV pilus assembly protein [Cellulomonas sp.]
MTVSSPRARPLTAALGSVRRARQPNRPGAERGSVTIEVVVLFPVLLVMVIAIVQYGLWFHARSLALAAAQLGVTAARTYTAEPAAGTQAATAFLDIHATDTLTDVTITATTPGAGQVGVEVSGRALSLLPGVPGPTVTQSAAGPVERFTTAGAP